MIESLEAGYQVSGAVWDAPFSVLKHYIDGVRFGLATFVCFQVW